MQYHRLSAMMAGFKSEDPITGLFDEMSRDAYPRHLATAKGENPQDIPQDLIQFVEQESVRAFQDLKPDQLVETLQTQSPGHVAWVLQTLAEKFGVATAYVATKGEVENVVASFTADPLSPTQLGVYALHIALQA